MRSPSAAGPETGSGVIGPVSLSCTETFVFVAGTQKSFALEFALEMVQPASGPNWGGYPVDETALRHGAGVERETTEPREAYARFAPRTATRYRDGWLPD